MDNNETTKMTLKKRFENYWYHYKWHTIIIGFFVFVFIFAFVQCAAKEEYDAHIMYAGPTSISFTSIQDLQEAFDDIMKEDYNEDGKKTVDYVELNFAVTNTSDDEQRLQNTINVNAQSASTDRERFNAEITAGQSLIYLLEEDIYQMVLESGILMPLADVLDNVPSKAADEYSFLLGDLPINELGGFCLLPEDTRVCIRYPIKINSSDNDPRVERNKKVFRDMIKYVLPVIEDEAE